MGKGKRIARITKKKREKGVRTLTKGWEGGFYRKMEQVPGGESHSKSRVERPSLERLLKGATEKEGRAWRVKERLPIREKK